MLDLLFYGLYVINNNNTHLEIARISNSEPILIEGPRGPPGEIGPAGPVGPKGSAGQSVAQGKGYNSRFLPTFTN